MASHALCEPTGAAAIEVWHGGDVPAMHWCALVGGGHPGPCNSLNVCFPCTVVEATFDRGACNELLARDGLHFRLAGKGAKVTGNDLQRGLLNARPAG